jgi:diacylglycerol kinase (ATP)
VRVALVANPRSGSGTDVDALAAALSRRGAQVRAFELGDIGELADCERVVVAGGDGTIGPAARAAARAGVPLAVVSSGTANDFARALELPLDQEAALDLAADPAAATTGVELLRAGGRPFVNAASAGLSVVAARAARPLKRPLGALAYAAGATLAGLTARPLAVWVRADGRLEFAGRAWQVIIGGTGAFGGGSGLARTDPGDGLLDVAIVPAGPRAGLLRRAWGMRSHRLEDQPGVRHARARRVELDVEAGTRFNVDGELCAVEPAVFEAEPPGFELVVRA